MPPPSVSTGRGMPGISVPFAAQSASPRTMLRLASVTMNGCGIAAEHEDEPVASPTARPVPRIASTTSTVEWTCMVDDRADDAREGDRRADREVDPAAEDHEQLPEREHRDHRRLREDVADVAAREEDGRRQADDDDEDQQDQRRAGAEAEKRDLQQPVAPSGSAAVGRAPAAPRSRASSAISGRAPRWRPRPGRPGYAYSASDDGQHLDAVAGGARARGSGRRSTTAGSAEVLVQVVDPLDDAVLQRAADADEVEDGEMLHVLAEADAAGMRADRDAELRRHQDDRQHLVDAGDAARVDLADVDRLGLEELLEDDAVLHVLAGRDADRRDGSRGSARGRGRRPGSSAPRSTTGRTRRATRSRRSPRRRPTPGSRPSSARRPAPSAVADERGAAEVGREVAADLHLDVAEAVGERLRTSADTLSSLVAEPAGRGRVRRDSPSLTICSSRSACPAAAARRRSTASSGERASSM